MGTYVFPPCLEGYFIQYWRFLTFIFPWVLGVQRIPGQSVVVLFKSPGIQRVRDKNAFLLVLKVHVFLWFSGYLEDWGLARSYCSNPAPPGFIKTLSSSLQGFIYRCKIAPPIILLLVDDFNIAAKEDLFPKPSGQIFQEFLNLNYWHFGVHSLTITTKGWPASWSL